MTEVCNDRQAVFLDGALAGYSDITGPFDAGDGQKRTRTIVARVTGL